MRWAPTDERNDPTALVVRHLEPVERFTLISRELPTAEVLTYASRCGHASFYNPGLPFEGLDEMPPVFKVYDKTSKINLRPTNESLVIVLDQLSRTVAVARRSIIEYAHVLMAPHATMYVIDDLGNVPPPGYDARHAERGTYQRTMDNIAVYWKGYVGLEHLLELLWFLPAAEVSQSPRGMHHPLKVITHIRGGK